MRILNYISQKGKPKKGASKGLSPQLLHYY